MTDLEISKALALAIGYLPTDVRYSYLSGVVLVQRQVGVPPRPWQVFDYRDWDVIGPIAERYDCFPAIASYHLCDEWLSMFDGIDVYADTPQKAIAMAVIEGAKK